MYDVSIPPQLWLKMKMKSFVLKKQLKQLGMDQPVGAAGGPAEDDFDQGGNQYDFF